MKRANRVATFLLSAGILLGQSDSNKLIYVLPSVIGSQGISGLRARTEVFAADGSFSQALVNGVGSTSNFTNVAPPNLGRAFNLGIATQLSALPIASPASGVLFRQDEATGALIPSADSLGTILTERAETIGKRRFYLGFSRQQIRFNKIEGESMGTSRILYAGGDATNITQNGRAQTIAPVVYDVNMDVRLDQNVAFLTYGLTNRVDVSAALTWVNATVSAYGYRAKMYNSGNPGDNGTCWCAATLNLAASQNDPNLGLAGLETGPFGSARRSSSGIGDTLFRVKGTALERRRYVLAVGADLRVPTGDAYNYHGSGAVSFKPFAALSVHSRSIGRVRFSPNFNIGYQVSGSSVLTGDPLTGEKIRLPDQFLWSAGTGITVSKRMTFVVDVLQNRLINANRLVSTSVSGRGSAGGTANGFALTPAKQSYNMSNGSFGVKVKMVGNMVFTANMLMALDNNGMRDRVVPLFGVGYSF
ncbi:MAG: hypothetical protein HY820_37410 [Acidobacteria bacterium]|nr:hypothetical protein [Acidobacteriota bacterium]